MKDGDIMGYRNRRKTCLIVFLVILAILLGLACLDLIMNADYEYKFNPFHTEHNFFYIVTGEEHRKVYDCGCYNYKKMRDHYDFGADFYCDFCGSKMRDPSKYPDYPSYPYYPFFPFY